MKTIHPSSGNVKQKTAGSLLALILGIFLLFSPGVTLPGLDAKTDNYFRDSISKAGISYGICRIVNGTVSVIKESTLQLEPGGIGMSLAIGQLVDPINDMVERLSHVLVMAITSLGIQELTYQIGVATAPPLLALLFLLIAVLAWIQHERVQAVRKILLSGCIIIFIARFFLPLSSLANDFLYKGFFEHRITAADAQLDRGLVDLDTLNRIKLPEKEGWLESIGNNAQSLKQKTAEFRQVIASIAQNKEQIIESLLQLTFLYLGIFIIQVLVLPLLTFWLLMQIVRALLINPA